MSEVKEDKLQEISMDIIEDNIQQGQQILDIYKGKTLYGLSGQSTNEQALSRGHFGGKAAGIISLFIMLQELLNELSAIKPELVPVMKKTSQGIIWVTDKEEALQLGKDYGYDIKQKGNWIINKNEKKFVVLPGEEDRYYFDYTGLTISDNDIADFAYNVARATASFQGETKQKISDALSNLKAVPIFQQGTMRPPPEYYENISEKEDK